MRVGFYGEGISDDIVVEKLIRLHYQNSNQIIDWHNADKIKRRHGSGIKTLCRYSSRAYKHFHYQLQCQMVLVVVDCDKNDFGHWRDNSHDSAQCPKCQRENDLSNTQKQVGASASKYCVGMPVPTIESWFAHSASVAKSEYSHLRDISYPEQKDKVTLKNLLYRSTQTDLSIVSQIISLFTISEYRKAKETCVSFRYFVDEIDCS
jgi:hypothetical protein